MEAQLFVENLSFCTQDFSTMPNLVQSVFLITMETSLQFTVCYIHCLFLGKFVFILPSIYDNELCIFVTLNMYYSRGGGKSVVV